MIEKLQFHEVHLEKMEPTVDRMDCVINGINHGRAVFFNESDQKYYKIFHPEYCRRKYFADAFEAGFFTPDIASALQGLIYDAHGIIGYTAEAGQTVKDEEWRYDNGRVPSIFWQKLTSRMNDTRIIYYDAVPSNIVKMPTGQYSLIDLESVYPYDNLDQCLLECSSTLKPFDLLDDLSIH